MSKFYQTEQEKRNNEVHKMHIRQANMVTRGKHTGSKSMSKLMFNIHRGTSMINRLMSGYNE